MAVLPTTVWRPSDGHSEASNPGTMTIADTTGALLVDASGVFIVDSGSILTEIPATVWEEDNSQ